MAKPPKLTAKQKRFVEEYLIDLNATAAAKRAGYSKHTAAQMGAENLTKPVLAQMIKLAMDKRSEEVGVDAAWVLKQSIIIYNKSIAADDRTNALKANDQVGKHINVQAFNERKTIEVTIEDASDEELDDILDALSTPE